MEVITGAWNQLLFEPMLNGLIFLYYWLFHNFALAIFVFTLIVRMAIWPLTIRQIRMMKVMGELQPKLAEIQKKYVKDRQRRSQEQMRLYKEYKVNPLGCMTPMLIQFPIWIALYQAMIQALPRSPETLLSLSQHLYDWLPWADRAVPIATRFLWLDLGRPDPLPILPVLVGASTWVQQKMTTMPAADPKQASTNKMMLWMMPMMFAFFSFSFASGLALYWIISNIIGIGMQAAITGWGPLLRPTRPPQPQEPKKGEENGEKQRVHRPDSRGGDRTRPKRDGGRPRKG